MLALRTADVRLLPPLSTVLAMLVFTAPGLGQEAGTPAAAPGGGAPAAGSAAGGPLLCRVGSPNLWDVRMAFGEGRFLGGPPGYGLDPFLEDASQTGEFWATSPLSCALLRQEAYGRARLLRLSFLSWWRFEHVPEPTVGSRGVTRPRAPQAVAGPVAVAPSPPETGGRISGTPEPVPEIGEGVGAARLTSQTFRIGAAPTASGSARGTRASPASRQRAAGLAARDAARRKFSEPDDGMGRSRPRSAAMRQPGRPSSTRAVRGGADPAAREGARRPGSTSPKPGAARPVRN